MRQGRRHQAPSVSLGIRHAPKLKLHRFRRATAMVMASLVAFTGGIAGFGILRLDGNMNVRDINGLLGNRPAAATTTGEKTPGDPFAGQAVNLLVMGSDSRNGENGQISGSSASDVEGMRADTTILVHVAADRKSAELVSIPRDTMVSIPSCQRSDGSHSDAEFGQFNTAFANGGDHGSVSDAAACTVKTVESITDIRISSYVVVDFSGFVNVINALGGVKICIPVAIDSDSSDIHIPAGEQTLNGDQALEYARAREGVGDGSDTSRISRQQYLLSAIVQQISSENLLTDLPQLYEVLNEATKSLTTGSELGSVTAMAGFAVSLKNLKPEDVSFITAPTEPYTYDANRLQFAEPAASQLFAALAQDQPVPGTSSASGGGSSSASSPTPSPSSGGSSDSAQSSSSSAGAQAATGSSTTSSSSNPYGASTAQSTGSCPAGTP